MRVPDYQPQTNIEPLPTYRQSLQMDPNAYGANIAKADAGLGQQLQQVSDTVEKDVQERQVKLNQAAVLNATTQMYDEWLPKYSELMSRQGINATGQIATQGAPGTLSVSDEGNQFLAYLGEKYSNTLGNEAQKYAFNQWVQRDFPTYRRMIFNHQRQQEHEYFLDSANARMVNGSKQFQSAALSGNTMLADKALTDAAADFTHIGNITLGQAPEMTASKLGKWYDSTIGDTILSMANDNPLQAQSYLDRYKNKLTPNLVQVLNDKIKPYILQNKELSITDDVLKRFTLQDGSGLIDEGAAKQYIDAQIPKTKTITSNGGLDGSAVIQEGEKELGKPYSLGADGVLSTDCGKFTQDVLGKFGINLGGRTADKQYLNLEQQGKVFTDQNQAKPGDLVFWDVPGNHGQWEPSDDPDAVNSDSKAYKGITHVGIYAGEGRVLQAGGSGVGYIDVNQYPVVGYGRVTDGLETAKEVTDPDSYILNQRVWRRVEAAASDRKRIYNENQKQYARDVLRDIFKTDSTEDKISIINNSNLEPYEKEEMLKRVTVAAKAQARTALTPEQKYYLEYEKSGLWKDTNTIETYSKISANGDTPTDVQTKSYEMALTRRDKYWQFSSGGKYDPQEAAREAGWKQSFDSDSTDKYANLPSGKAQITQDEYAYLKSQGISENEINDKYTVVGGE